MPIYDYTRNPWKRRLAETILRRDGDRCQNPECKGSPRGLLLELAHRPPFTVRDGWRLDILYLLCHPCNSHQNIGSIAHALSDVRGNPPLSGELKGLRLAGLPLDMFPNPSVLMKQLIDYRSGGPQMHASKVFEVKFLEWIFNLIHREVYVRRKNALNGGARYAGCSQTAIGRYLDKEIDPYGGGLLNEREDEVTGELLIEAKKEVWEYWRENPVKLEEPVIR